MFNSLKKYAVFSKVDFNDVSRDWQKVGLSSASAIELINMQQLFNIPVNGLAQSGNILSLSIPGPNPRFILLLPSTNPMTRVDTNNFAHKNLNQWNLLDIMAGIPTVYPETIGQFTPHQLNYPAIGGVSLNKGCYIGQEIIARTHYLGKSKSRLYRISFKTNNQPTSGTPLLEDDELSPTGMIIMSAYAGKSHYQALACLQTKAISHIIHLEGPQGPIVELLALPYPI